MAIGRKLLGGVALLAVAACTGQQGKLTIRATSSPLAAESRPVPARIAEARAQLLLGNVGLALESYRIAARDDPSSSEALAGLAECYDRIRRFDLSRRYYEAALAISPADAGLLERLAVSLERQRKPAEAAEVRREIAMRREQAATPSIAEPAATPMGSAQIAVPAQTVTLPLAPPSVAAPAAVAMAPAQDPPVLASPPAKAEPAIAVAAAPPPVTLPAVRQSPAAAPAVAAAPAAVAAAPVAAPPLKVRPEQMARVPVAPVSDPRPLPEQQATNVAPAAPAASVTVTLPPARPATALASVEPSPSKRPEAKRQLARVGGEPPRLERLSLAEVALVTKAAPLWQPRVVAQSNRSTTIRFVPLKQHSQATASVRLLNAARSHRLAAHTRDYLSAKGWRRIAIGDADEVRETSVIYYPESRRRTAEILAAQFRIRVLRRAGEDSAIVMLLGRDAARTRSRRTSA